MTHFLQPIWILLINNPSNDGINAAIRADVSCLSSVLLFMVTDSFNSTGYTTDRMHI